jgi:hypothetical protein
MTNKEREKTFFVLAHRFREALDPKEIEQLGDQLSCLVFGARRAVQP